MDGIFLKGLLMHVLTGFAVWMFFLADIVRAEPVMISPGQCIMVGSQQVCAAKVECTTPPTEVKSIKHFLCRYGVFKESEVPTMKTYELVESLVKPDGNKVEINLKNFGMNGREACEIEAQQKEAKQGL